jgi:hypothetical protein
VRVAVAAPILARTDAEADLLVGSVAALAAHGLPTFLVDGGSPSGFVDRLRAAAPGVTVEPVRDGSLRLVSQIQQALPLAAEHADYILYTEPDKRWFFESALWRLLRDAPLANRPGIVVPARDAASFATFPAGQRLPESLFNRLAAENLSLPDGADVLYGPLLIRADLVPYVGRLREAVGWGWRTYLLAVARRLGAAITLWPADLPCPADQRGEEDEQSRLYRIAQMAQNVRGLELGLREPL